MKTTVLGSLLTFIFLIGIPSYVHAEDGAIFIPIGVTNTAKTVTVIKLNDTSVKIQWKGFCKNGWFVTYGTDASSLSTEMPVNCSSADTYGQGIFSIALTNLQSGVPYFYRIPTSGEANTQEHYFGGQFTLNATGVVSATNIKFWLPVRYSVSSEVVNLQEFLREQGLLANGNVTGFYGPLTKKAVTAFQEKYAPAILTPLGLTHGTGFAGAATIKQINALWGF